MSSSAGLRMALRGRVRSAMRARLPASARAVCSPWSQQSRSISNRGIRERPIRMPYTQLFSEPRHLHNLLLLGGAVGLVWYVGKEKHQSVGLPGPSGSFPESSDGLQEFLAEGTKGSSGKFGYYPKSALNHVQALQGAKVLSLSEEQIAAVAEGLGKYPQVWQAVNADASLNDKQRDYVLDKLFGFAWNPTSPNGSFSEIGANVYASEKKSWTSGARRRFERDLTESLDITRRACELVDDAVASGVSLFQLYNGIELYARTQLAVKAWMGKTSIKAVLKDALGDAYEANFVDAYSTNQATVAAALSGEPAPVPEGKSSTGGTALLSAVAKVSCCTWAQALERLLVAAGSQQQSSEQEVVAVAKALNALGQSPSQLVSSRNDWGAPEGSNLAAAVAAYARHGDPGKLVADVLQAAISVEDKVRWEENYDASWVSGTPAASGSLQSHPYSLTPQQKQSVMKSLNRVARGVAVGPEASGKVTQSEGVQLLARRAQGEFYPALMDKTSRTSQPAWFAQLDRPTATLLHVLGLYVTDALSGGRSNFVNSLKWTALKTQNYAEKQIGRRYTYFPAVQPKAGSDVEDGLNVFKETHPSNRNRPYSDELSELVRRAVALGAAGDEYTPGTYLDSGFSESIGLTKPFESLEGELNGMTREDWNKFKKIWMVVRGRLNNAKEMRASADSVMLAWVEACKATGELGERFDKVESMIGDFKHTVQEQKGSLLSNPLPSGDALEEAYETALQQDDPNNDIPTNPYLGIALLTQGSLGLESPEQFKMLAALRNAYLRYDVAGEDSAPVLSQPIRTLANQPGNVAGAISQAHGASVKSNPQAVFTGVSKQVDGLRDTLLLTSFRNTKRAPVGAIPAVVASMTVPVVDVSKPVGVLDHVL